jgi:hypothetical protein
VKTIAVEIPKDEGKRDEGTLEWVFEFQGRSGSKEVRWSTKTEQRPDLSNNAVAMWPPETSDDWHFYVARCFGSSKSKSGTWILVDENGRHDDEQKAFALDVTLKEGKTDVTEYVSHVPLAESPTQPNKPRFLMLLDTDENVERGVLFLDDSMVGSREKSKQPSATLAVDFGTSNTCLALGTENKREPLVFSLSPLMLWGRQPKNEIPGRVPFAWQGNKFFPTIFMSRKKSGVEQISAEQLKVGNFFQIDIPSLHRGMEDGVFSRAFDGWNIETNLKWKLRVENNSYRTLFLGLSLLYAHAEVFFRADSDRGVQIKDYVFSFPLAFTSTEETQFCRAAKDVTKTIRRFCYGDDDGDYHKIDESTAVAVQSGIAEHASTLQVFIDVGGGTTDIAVRNREDFPSRDSIKVAGRTFFGFAEESFKSEVGGAKDFKTNLGRLLWKEDKELRLDNVRLDLGTYYSLAVSRLEAAEFLERESIVLQEGMGNNSYQRYRALVFFRQIIAYALLQAFAAAVTIESEADIQSLEVVLAGNAWGLMLFAELKRRKPELTREVDRIFRFLKVALEKVLEKDAKVLGKKTESEERLRRLNSLASLSVKLLNEDVLSNAKTAVAMGAVKARSEGKTKRISEKEDEERKATAFAGLTFSDSMVNGKPLPIAWYDKWDVEYIKERFKDTHEKELLAIDRFTTGNLANTKQPFDELLKVFFQLANLASYDDEVPLEEQWQSINALLHQDRIYHRSAKELGMSPISYFVGGLLYPEDSEHEYLKELARANKTL